MHQGLFVEDGIPSQGSVPPMTFEQKTMNYSSVATWLAGDSVVDLDDAAQNAQGGPESSNK